MAEALRPNSATPVTIFLPSLAGGGAERSMLSVANGLAARGVNVTLALAKAVGPYLQDVRPEVRVLDLKSTTVPRALPGLVRHLRRTRPVAVLSAMSQANVAAALAHRWSGRPGRLVLSERVHPSSLFSEFPGLRTRLLRALMRLTYPWADAIVTVSQGVADDLTRVLPVAQQRVTTIYNPVVDEQLRKRAQATPTHPWLLSKEAPVILAVGRLIAQKDFATLIDAFALLRRRRALRLLILGEGELRSSLQAYAERLGIGADIALPGFDPNPFAAMRTAAVFVLSSRFEGLPGVLIQAMACGARSVSTDCPSGPREILEDGRWGRLVPVGDAAAMAAAIAAALDDSQPADARVRAEAFNEERAIAAYAGVLGLPVMPAPHV